MTQAQIRKARKAIEKKIAAAQGQIKVLHAQWEVVSAQCEHPGQYATSCMGDSGTYCPDCGHAT